MLSSKTNKLNFSLSSLKMIIQYYRELCDAPECIAAINPSPQRHTPEGVACEPLNVSEYSHHLESRTGPGTCKNSSGVF